MADPVISYKIKVTAAAANDVARMLEFKNVQKYSDTTAGDLYKVDSLGYLEKTVIHGVAIIQPCAIMFPVTDPAQSGNVEFVLNCGSVQYKCTAALSTLAGLEIGDEATVTVVS